MHKARSRVEFSADFSAFENDEKDFFLSVLPPLSAAKRRYLDRLRERIY